jgi:hypothetical protein
MMTLVFLHGAPASGKLTVANGPCAGQSPERSAPGASLPESASRPPPELQIPPAKSTNLTRWLNFQLAD